MCTIQRLGQLAWLLLRRLTVGLGSVWGTASRSGTDKTHVGAPGSRAASSAPRHFPSGYTSFSEKCCPTGLGFSTTCCITFNARLLHNYGLPSSQHLCNMRCSPTQEMILGTVQQVQQRRATALHRSARVTHRYGCYHAWQFPAWPCSPHMPKCPLLTDGFK